MPSPNLSGLDAEQSVLVRDYCASWVLLQGHSCGHQTFMAGEYETLCRKLRLLRDQMSDLARLRCSQFERAWARGRAA